MGKEAVGGKDAQGNLQVEESITKTLKIVEQQLRELCQHGTGKRLIEITARHDRIVSAKVGREESFQIGPN